MVALGLVSMLSAAITSGVTFLDLEARAKRHMEPAADFQRLRRESDEKTVRLAEGKAREGYDNFKDHWHKVLRTAPLLPQDIHDRVNRNFEAKTTPRSQYDPEEVPQKGLITDGTTCDERT